MDNNTQLQQSSNAGVIIGKLKDKKIEFGVGKDSGKAYAKGQLVVVVNTPDGINEVKVNVMQMALKKDGGENGLYKALQTINNEYKTVVANGEEFADTIKIEGSLEMNDYYNKNKDEVSSFLQVKGAIINRVDANSEHMAKFKLGGYIDAITDKEDGTADVALTSIAYGGHCFPAVVTIPKEGVPTFKGMFFVGCTADINFDMVNAVEVSKTVDNVGWGQGLDTVAEKRIRVNRAFGGDVKPVGYQQDQIVLAKNIRQQKLETMLLEGREKASKPAPANNPASGFGTGFGAPAGTPATGAPAGGFTGGFGAPAGGFGGAGFGAPAGTPAGNPFTQQ